MPPDSAPSVQTTPEHAGDASVREFLDAIDEGACVIEMRFDETGAPVDYRFLAVNAAFSENTTYVSPAGKWKSELDPTRDDFWLAFYGNIARSGKPARTANESRGRWYEVSASRLGDERSRKVAVLFKDITARRLAELELRSTQERIEATLRAGEVSTWIWDVGKNQVHADRNLARLFEVSDEDARGGPIEAYLHAMHPDDRERTAALIAKSLESGEPYEAEYRLVHRDGGVRTVIARGRPERDATGKTTRLPGVVLDVTHQRKAEAALRASEAQLHFALKAGRMGTWELDLSTETLSASDTCKANYGRGPEDPFGYDVLASSVLEEDREAWRDSVGTAIATGSDFETESRASWPDGSVHWVYVRGSCTKDTAGKVVTLSGVSLLIDERKRTEEALRAADRQKDEFLSTASHELRTPLNAILGWARLLRAGKLDAGTASRGLDAIERNAVAQVQIIEDILDGARMITGNLRLEVRPLDLTELVTAALDTVRAAADAKGIALVANLDPAAARVAGDPERLQQLVWNLVNNAIKFTPKGGHVAIDLVRTDSDVTLTVSDSGQGIAAAFLPHVFDRFRQADGTSTRRHGGLGLGLALVRHLAEAHGGTVRAESSGEGLGARFVVTLPVQAVFPRPSVPEPSRPPTPVDPRPAAGSLTGIRVLVVDDEADARELVATVLRAQGATITTAASALRALELIADTQPDVIVSDIGMPDVDGYELMRRLRERERAAGAAPPAVALTAYAREEDRRRALEAGFLSHVTKPIEPDELVRVVVALVVPAEAPLPA